MERITFLLEPSQERLSAQLNPETVEVRRSGGLVRRTLPQGAVNALSDNDDALLHTGGGRTEVELDLLFDLDVAGWSGDQEDVRELTERFFKLTEALEATDSRRRVPSFRFLWGKRWNMLAVVEAVSQRLERFGPDGAPRRSWMRLRLVRVPEPHPAAAMDAARFPESGFDGGAFDADEGFEAVPPEGPVYLVDEGSRGIAEPDWRDALPGGSRLEEFLEEIQRRAGGGAVEDHYA